MMLNIKNVGSTKTYFKNNSGKHFNKVNWNADYDGNQAHIHMKTNEDGVKRQIYYNLDNRDLANLLNVDSVNVPVHERLKRDFKNKKKPCLRRYGSVYRIELPNTDTYTDTYTDTDTDTNFSSIFPDEDEDDSTVWSTVSSSPYSITRGDVSLGEMPMPISMSTPRHTPRHTPMDDISSLTYSPSPIDVSNIRDTMELLSNPQRGSRVFLSSPLSGEEFIVPVSINRSPHKRYKKYTFTPKKRNLTLKSHRTYRVFKHPKKKTIKRRKHRKGEKTL